MQTLLSNIRSIITALIILLITVCFSDLSAIERNPIPIILEYADTLRSVDNQREVIGNVRFRHGNKLLTADHAIYNPFSGKVTLTGSVELDEPGKEMDADQVIYHERTGNFEASGSVNMAAGDSVTILCERAYYFEKDSLIELYENVTINSLADGAQIFGMKGVWRQGSNVAEVRGSPVYSLPDPNTDPPDTLTIRSTQIHFNQQNRSAIFIGSVTLRKGLLRAKADTLFHMPDSNITSLSGSPIIWQDKDELSGDHIELYYKENKLQRIFAFGEAQVLSQSQENDPRRSRLSGDSLTITTVSDSLRIIHVDGNAQGFYHLWNEDADYQGVNLAAADMIEITIFHEKTDNLILKGDVSGSFYPPDKAPDMDKSKIFKSDLKK